MENQRPLTRHFRKDGVALGLQAYEKRGGYRALRNAIGKLAPEEITRQVTEANLRGRGGAGFPTGRKWSFVPMGEDAPHPKYLVVNADEMEPGTFKDRWLMEANPHQLIEGIVLSAYAIQADVAFIFLRWEYRQSAERLQRAIAEASTRAISAPMCSARAGGWSCTCTRVPDATSAARRPR